MNNRVKKCMTRFIELITGAVLDRLEVEASREEDPEKKSELNKRIHAERAKSALAQLASFALSSLILWVAEQVLPETP
jgi:hypothetical protein